MLFASLALILLYVFWQPLPTILWSAPLMTVGHIFFATSMTVYIFIGIWHEERDLTNLYGAHYERYKRTTSRIVPLPKAGVFQPSTNRTAQDG